MAARIGLTLAALQRIDPGACATDARLVWKDGDPWNWGIVLHDGSFLNLRLSGTRELRLLAKQMLDIADHAERAQVEDPFEVVLK